MDPRIWDELATKLGATPGIRRAHLSTGFGSGDRIELELETSGGVHRYNMAVVDHWYRGRSYTAVAGEMYERIMEEVGRYIVGQSRSSRRAPRYTYSDPSPAEFGFDEWPDLSQAIDRTIREGDPIERPIPTSASTWGVNRTATEIQTQIHEARRMIEENQRVINERQRLLMESISYYAPPPLVSFSNPPGLSGWDLLMRQGPPKETDGSVAMPGPKGRLP